MLSLFFFLLMEFFVVPSIAIGREGGVAPLIALARSDAEVSCDMLQVCWILLLQHLFDVHETSLPHSDGKVGDSK